MMRGFKRPPEQLLQEFRDPIDGQLLLRLIRLNGKGWHGIADWMAVDFYHADAAKLAVKLFPSRPVGKSCRPGGTMGSRWLYALAPDKEE